MNKLRAVLFDLDNTLYENDEPLEAWARARAASLLNQEQAVSLVSHLTRALTTMDIRSCESSILVSQIAKAIPELSTEAAEFLEIMLRNWLLQMHLNADAAELLDVLDIKGIPFGIVTNAPAFQLIKIGALGIMSRTKCIFVSEQFGAEKPDPGIFQAAAEALDVQSGQILFVGDSPYHDIIGAHNAGMKAAWVRRGRDWPQELESQKPDYELGSLMDVMEIVVSRR